MFKNPIIDFINDKSRDQCRKGEINNLTCNWVCAIEEGRAASKSSHWKVGYFLSMSQEADSAVIIPNSAVGIFSPKTEGAEK